MASTSFAASVVPSATASYAIARATQELSDSSYRISSGHRFLPGQDNASLSLSAQLQSNIAASREGINNGSAAGSLLSIASDALSQIGELLSHARTVALQAQDAGLSDSDRGQLQASFQGDFDAINTIVSTTSFNHINLLDGSLSDTDGGTTLNIKVGDASSAHIAIEIPDVSTTQLFSGGTPTLATSGDAVDAIGALDDAAAKVAEAQGITSGGQLQVNFAVDNLHSQIGGIETARASLSDTDVPQESTRFISRYVQQKAAFAILAQSRGLHSGLLNLLKPGNPKH